MLSMNSVNGKSRKIIAFDSWTGGFRHYKRLAAAFYECDLELMLIHIGSWGVDKDQPKEEWREGMHIRDISYYGNASFSEIIDLEQPSAVLFLSTDTFAHRAFNRLAHSKEIPTIHLYHGIMSTLAVDVAKPYERNLTTYLWFVVTRVVKMFTKVWPSYAKALLSTQGSWHECKRFFADNVDLLFGRERLDSALDAKTDLCCIYTNGDREHAVTRYGFKDDQVIAVGNPDIVQFGLNERLIGAYSERMDECNDVMYIDTALLLRGASFSCQKEFIDHLVETNAAVSNVKNNLIVKLHPDHFKTDVPDQLRKRGVDVCPDDQFIKRLKSSCAVIVEPSSAALIPALMGIPILLARYGPLDNQHYGKILRDYPFGVFLDDLSCLDEKIEAGSCDLYSDAFDNWLIMNAGPLPANLMPNRVAQSVDKLIRTQ